MRKMTLRYCGTLTGLLTPLLLGSCQDNAELCSTETSNDGTTNLVCLPVGGLGTSTLAIRRAEPAGEHCPNGGERIDTGFDDNGNNVLDASEIDVSAYICNGADGIGVTGPAGVSGEDGVDGVGATGLGFNSLVLVDPEGGEGCEFGGFDLVIGVDDGASGDTEAVAGDGALDADEIDHVEVVCTGDPGPIGATGATGPIGAGETGATGASGAEGSDGAIGPTGATGVTGTDGTNGATGPTGASGTDGTNGENGATGVTGTDGTNGENGATGATGVTGTDGANGATGATGVTGADGATGPTGADGATGGTGATGETGVDGNATFTSSFDLVDSELNTGDAITFSSNEFFNPNLTHQEGSADFVAVTGGTYLIRLEVDVSSVSGLEESNGVGSFVLEVNGSPTLETFNLVAGRNVIELLEGISAGDVFSFVSTEPNDGDDVFLETPVGIRVRFTLVPPL